MSLNSQPLWLEGMFIRPQHLQQQNRYLETLVEHRVAGIRPNGWGLRSLTIDRNQLRIGSFGLSACEVIMPDGTVIAIPADLEPPEARNIPADLRDCVVKLALPARGGDGLEILTEQGSSNARLRIAEQELRDSTSAERRSAVVKLGIPRLRLLLEGESEDNLVCLSLARIEQVDASGSVVLAPSFIPPALDCLAVPRLSEIVREIEGLLHTLGNTVAGRVDPSRMVGEMAGILDYLLLITINRFEPLFATFGRSQGLHPQDLHIAMLQLAGELSTYGLKQRRPAAFPTYRHDDLDATLTPVLAAIRSGLVVVMDERVIAIQLQPRDYGIWIGLIGDKSLLRSARFVLAVKATMPPETLRSRFPMQVKLGPVEVIRDLVNLQIPGIGLDPLPVAPRELPYYGGFTYFELNQASELWGRLTTSSAFALHVGAEFADLSMELWAIRGSRE